VIEIEYPAPAVDDGANHVYVSVGHQQMMTDAMKPLGLSIWQLIALPVMHEAGGRLFVEITDRLATPTSRAAMLEVMGRGDPLIRDALTTVLDRGDFVPTLPEPPEPPPPPAPSMAGAPAPIENDPAIVAGLVEGIDAGAVALQHALADVNGPAAFDLVLDDIRDLKQTLLLDPVSSQAIMASHEATWWLNDQLLAWLGERNAADVLTRSAPHNVTSEMGLALLDLADVLRPHPSVVAFLQQVADADPDDAGFLEELAGLPDGEGAHAAFVAFLARYGARCVGEIDITRPRWRERPATVLPAILGNVRNFPPGEARRRFERGEAEAAAGASDVLERLRALPDGAQKAVEAERMIDRLRTFAGYREHPKFGIVGRLDLYKQAIVAEVEQLVGRGVLRRVEDASFLRFEELHEAVRTGEVDLGLVDQREAAFRSHEQLEPPRVLTSEGEGLAGDYGRDDVPVGSLVGLGVSAGFVEGRARVAHDIVDAELEPGDILVTAFTDPSWTPVFVTIAGLVTEVGGQMTHGAVVAREYGLPAVVGVAGATRRIRDGQWLRVHGTEGYVELLARSSSEGP
jgi:phosphohistidine swiveling domain-containing protein